MSYCTICYKYMRKSMRDKTPVCIECDMNMGMYRFTRRYFRCKCCSRVKHYKITVYPCLHELCTRCYIKYSKKSCLDCEKDKANYNRCIII